jgi:hypothetical protein
MKRPPVFRRNPKHFSTASLILSGSRSPRPAISIMRCDDLLHGRRLALVMQFSTSFVEGLANECRRLRIEGSIRDLKGLFRRRDG